MSHRSSTVANKSQGGPTPAGLGESRHHPRPAEECARHTAYAKLKISLETNDEDGAEHCKREMGKMIRDLPLMV